MYLLLALLPICFSASKLVKTMSLPKIIPIKRTKVTEGKDSIEILKMRIVEFLDKHGKLNPTNPFRSPINEDFVAEEFNRIAKEGGKGVILDLYIAIVICLKFYIISHHFYRLDLHYVRKMQKIACYILEHEADIACRYTSSAELHASIGELCKPQKIRIPIPVENVPIVILSDQVQPQLHPKSDDDILTLPTDELQHIASQPLTSGYKDVKTKNRYEVERLHLASKEASDLLQET